MKKVRILIVEDEAIIAMEIESQLQSLGYEVTSIVDTGEEAIAKAEEDKPDLILMDIRIKGEMDGIKAAEEIRNRFGIPVIFSTAYLDEERIERAKITMPFGYVLKPIQERDLKVTIEMALYVAKVDAERKKTEDEIKSSEVKYRDLVEFLPQGMFETDEMGNLIFANRTALEMFETTEVDLNKGINILQWIAPEDQERTTSNMSKVISGQQFGGIEYSAITRKGKKFPIIAYSKQVIHKNKTVHKGIVIDIAERKKAEEALTQSEKRFKMLFENIQDGFALHELVYDENQKPIDYKFVEINSSFERITGLKKEDIVGKKVTEALPGIENDPADWIGTYAKVVTNNEPINFEQFSENLNNWFSCRAFKTEENCFAVSFTKITARKMAES